MQGGFGPAAAFGKIAADFPVVVERAGPTQGGLDRAIRQGKFQGGAQVVVFRVEAGQPFQLGVGSQGRFGLFGKGEEPVAVAKAGRGGVPREGQFFGGVLVFSGAGSPCVITVDSSATTALPWSSAAFTSG